MRVAIHYPADHPESPGAVGAYRLGRVEEGVHNAPPGFPPIPIEQYLATMVEQAQKENPGCEIVIERLVADHDHWHCVDCHVVGTGEEASAHAKATGHNVEQTEGESKWVSQAEFEAGEVEEIQPGETTGLTVDLVQDSDAAATGV